MFGCALCDSRPLRKDPDGRLAAESPPAIGAGCGSFIVHGRNPHAAWAQKVVVQRTAFARLTGDLFPRSGLRGPVDPAILHANPIHYRVLTTTPYA